MTELQEITDGKNFDGLIKELKHQIANGEAIGGAIVGEILYLCNRLATTEKHIRQRDDALKDAEIRNMAEVSQEEFYHQLNAEKLDVIISVIGNFPYITHFKYRKSGVIFGKCVERYADGHSYPLIKKFYLPKVKPVSL